MVEERCSGECGSGHGSEKRNGGEVVNLRRWRRGMVRVMVFLNMVAGRTTRV